MTAIRTSLICAVLSFALLGGAACGSNDEIPDEDHLEGTDAQGTPDAGLAAADADDGPDAPADGRHGCVGMVLWPDEDGDGYGAGHPRERCLGPGWTANNLDCNDGDATIHPGVTEACDGVDQNCNGLDDEPTCGA